MSLADMRLARARLSELREESDRSRTLTVSVEMLEPKSGTEMHARGAVAIVPKEALRLVLLGPGGLTAFDVWMGNGRYRMEIPALGLLKSGRIDTGRFNSQNALLPIGFFDFWLLDPWGGDLLFYEKKSAAELFVLRRRDAIVMISRESDGAIAATRSVRDSRSQEIVREYVRADGLGCKSVEYTSASNLVVRVQCERETAGVSNPRALKDPLKGSKAQ